MTDPHATGGHRRSIWLLLGGLLLVGLVLVLLQPPPVGPAPASEEPGTAQPADPETPPTQAPGPQSSGPEVARADRDAQPIARPNRTAAGSPDDSTGGRFVLTVQETIYREVTEEDEVESGEVWFDWTGKRPAPGAEICWTSSQEVLTAIAEEPALAEAWIDLLDRTNHHILVDPARTPLPKDIVHQGVTDDRGRIELPNDRGSLVMFARKGKQVGWDVIGVEPGDREWDMELSLGGILRIQVLSPAGRPLANAHLDSTDGDLEIATSLPLICDEQGMADLAVLWSVTSDTTTLVVGPQQEAPTVVGVDALDGPPVTIQATSQHIGSVQLILRGAGLRPLPGYMPITLAAEQAWDAIPKPSRVADGVMEWRGLPLGTKLYLSNEENDYPELDLVIPPLSAAQPAWRKTVDVDPKAPALAFRVLDPSGKPIPRAEFYIDGPDPEIMSLRQTILRSDDQGVVLVDAPRYDQETPSARRYVDITLSVAENRILERSGLTTRLFTPDAKPGTTWLPPVKLARYAELGSGTITGTNRFRLDCTVQEWPDHVPEPAHVVVRYTEEGFTFRVLGSPSIRSYHLSVAEPDEPSQVFGPFRSGQKGLAIKLGE